MTTEIELKLRLSPSDAARVLRNPWLRALGGPDPVTRRLRTVYYDTPAFHLRRHGVALRLRREGRHWIQSVKGGGSVAAGLHRREEQEAPVLGPHPDFTKIADPALARLLASDKLRERLRPLFTTTCQRNTRMLRLPDGSEVEFCLDRGTIAAGDGEGPGVPLCEIELELKSGHPLSLFQLAQALMHHFPVRIEHASKAARGYALVSGAARTPLKARPPRLTSGMGMDAALKAVVQSCLDHLHGNETGMLEGSGIEYLHQMRVALRRLRSAFGLFCGKQARTGLIAPAAGELKWLAGQLGPARDWDVFTEETLAAVDAALPDHAGISELRDRCERMRQHHGEIARQAVASRRYTETMLSLGAWLCGAPLEAQQENPQAPDDARADMGVGPFARKLLTRRHRQLRKHGRTLQGLGAPALHAVRILAKKQRYAVEFLSGLYPAGAAGAYLDSLSALQDILGILNDATVARGLLGEMSAAGEDRHPTARGRQEEHEAIGIVLGWSLRQACPRQDLLDDAWQRFRSEQPFW